MGISLSVDRVWTLLNDKGQRKRESIFKYLDQVANEAKTIADIWEQTYKEIVDERYSKLDEDTAEVKLRELKYQLGYYSNIGAYSALKEFYSSLSVAVDGDLDGEWMDRFIHGIATVLQQRDHAKESYNTLISNFRTAFFVSEDNRIDNLRNFSQSVEVLQREAAALSVLAKTIRAKFSR